MRRAEALRHRRDRADPIVAEEDDCFDGNGRRRNPDAAAPSPDQTRNEEPHDRGQFAGEDQRMDRLEGDDCDAVF